MADKDGWYYFFEFGKILVPAVAACLVLIQLRNNRRAQAEVTFFNLLKSIRDMVAITKGNVVKQDASIVDFSGNEYFYRAALELRERQLAALGKGIVDGLINTKVKDEKTVEEFHQLAVDTYNRFYNKHVPELGHYFRFTYNVLKFVDEHPFMSSQKKKDYINFVQAQMTDGELQLLYYNGIGEYGEKYYDLIESYDFLQNMDPSEMRGIIDSLSNFYPKARFRILKTK